MASGRRRVAREGGDEVRGELGRMEHAFELERAGEHVFAQRRLAARCTPSRRIVVAAQTGVERGAEVREERSLRQPVLGVQPEQRILGS